MSSAWYGWGDNKLHFIFSYILYPEPRVKPFLKMCAECHDLCYLKVTDTHTHCTCAYKQLCYHSISPPVFLLVYSAWTSWCTALWPCPPRHSIYLFICLHSFLLFLAGTGEGNYWCGTAGEEANLSLGTSEVWGWPREASVPHLFHFALEEKRGQWEQTHYGIRHGIWPHTDTHTHAATQSLRLCFSNVGAKLTYILPALIYKDFHQH